MDKIEVTGGVPLKGAIEISGAKNAALPLMAACLLTEQPLTLHNVPFLSDITTMIQLLKELDVHISIRSSNHEEKQFGRTVVLQANNTNHQTAPYEIVRKMRASVVVLGPLLARFGYAKVSLPGGCAIGTRPIDFHLQALEKMGADIELDEGYVIATTKNGLHGADITFPSPSVGATQNILMAACLAKGTSKIHNAAIEPEILDLVACLKKMGAKIRQSDSGFIIQGVEKLKSAEYEVMYDRIEAGSYAIAAAITGGDLELQYAPVKHMQPLLEQLHQCGVQTKKTRKGLRVWRNKNLLPFSLHTAPHPGFPTDMQAQMTALAAIIPGTSHIAENIFENRFMHVAELQRMGAKINQHHNSISIEGAETLRAAEVMATDLRASMSLVLAALVAQGTTTINRVYHVDRGYERIEEKLSKCGARIKRV